MASPDLFQLFVVSDFFYFLLVCTKIQVHREREGRGIGVRENTVSAHTKKRRVGGGGIGRRGRIGGNALLIFKW